jgi:restriction system protein
MKHRYRNKLTKRQLTFGLAFVGWLAIAAYLGPSHLWLSGGVLVALSIGVIAASPLRRYLTGRAERCESTQRHSRAGITDVDKMDGFEFERFLGNLLKSKGYKVRVTQETGDFGADLVIEDCNGLRGVIQAKRYTGAVGIKAVQEIVGSKSYYKATEAFCITNSTYTKAAITLAKSNNVALLTRKELLKLMSHRSAKAQ